MNKSDLQEQAKLLILSIKGDDAAKVPNISDIAKGGMMGLMSNPNALIEAAQELSGRFDSVVKLAENLNLRICELEGGNRE